MRNILKIGLITLLLGTIFIVGNSLASKSISPPDNNVAHWSLLTSGDNPAPRYGHAMSYDAARQKIVLFGGNNWSDETWELDKNGWALKTPANKPSPRYTHSMTYDSKRAKVVLFGGVLPHSKYSNETWEWDGANWIQKAPAHQPTARSYAGLAFDQTRGKVVLFGGETETGPNSETWEWDGADWTQRFPKNSPKPFLYCGPAMVYDASLKMIVLFRGFGWTNEICLWDGQDWTVKSPANGTDRCSMTLAYDSDRQTLVLSGGNETWLAQKLDWTLYKTNVSPDARWGHYMVYDSGRHKVVLFGGTVGYYPTNETWEFGF